jgi:hypothetical protein
VADQPGPDADPTTADPSRTLFDRECFFITPLGQEGSAERKRADGLLKAVVAPCASALGLTPVRADRIDEGGHITLQVLEHCANAKAAVADLTGGNLNVYYEVGIRHALRQPVVLLADDSERGKLPFDLLQQRTIFYTNDMAGAAACQESVTEQLRRAIDGHVDSPVQAAINLRALQQGTDVERTLADLVTKVAEIAAALGPPSPPSLPMNVGVELIKGFVAIAGALPADRAVREPVLSALEVMIPALSSVAGITLELPNIDQPTVQKAMEDHLSKLREVARAPERAAGQVESSEDDAARTPATAE